MTCRRHSTATACLVMAACALSGCHTTEGPAVLRVDGGDYNRTFDACIEAGRGSHMAPALADRGNGVIETEPRTMGSLLEPWRLDTSGPDQALESTLQFQRRRIRFVFVPEGFEPQVIDGRSDFTGGSEPGSPSDMARFDLERHPGPLELRCVVVIERGFTPGRRPSTWTSLLASQSSDPIAKASDDGSTRQPTLWTPVGRDEAAERTMLARVQELLETGLQPDDTRVTSGQPTDAPSS
jgi:hypothetical protein